MTTNQWNEADEDSLGTGVMEWFIVHTYSGFEKKVMDSLRQRAEVEGIDKKVGEILMQAERHRLSVSPATEPPAA